MVIKAGEKTERSFDEQAETAIEQVVAPIERMLQAGEIKPHVIVFAVAKVTGELTAAFAEAGGYDQERVLKDIAEVVLRSGRDYHKALTEETPVAGNA